MIQAAPADGLKPFIARVAAGERLTEDDAAAAFDIILAGNATPVQIAALVMGLRVRGETIDEIAGAARAMRAGALKVSAPDGAIDTCGTGGDARGTFNISTAVGLVLAGARVPVAKHGNRSISSKSGSADVLQALGVKVDATPDTIARCMREARIGFMFAPAHHAGMRHAAAARQELGVRTIFNILGPLANPAGIRRQVLGVYAEALLEPMAAVLGRLGVERAWVVHGADGLDEITLTAATKVVELTDGELRRFEVAPEDAGLKRCSADDLRGGDAPANARSILTLLDGASGAFRDIVLLNAAAGLIVADKAVSLNEGVSVAAASIDSGSARDALKMLVTISNGAAA